MLVAVLAVKVGRSLPGDLQAERRFPAVTPLMERPTALAAAAADIMAAVAALLN